MEDTHLKKQIFLWRFFLLLLVFCSLILVQGRAQSRNAQKQSPQAADAKEKNVKEYVELLRTDVRQQKAQILGAVMQFDVDQAAKFWPIYNDYDAELTKLNNLRLANIQEYAKHYSDLTDAKADELIQKALDYRKQRADLLAKAYQIAPEHLFVEQLADLYRSGGQTQSADGVAKIVLQAYEQHERDGWNVNREYAMFCANQGINLQEALERSKKEFETRPDNIDVLETYAWTLLKAGRPREAVPLVEKAMRLNTKSFTLHYHAGVIYSAAGMQDEAQKYFAQAQTENPYMKIFCIDGGQQMKNSQGITANQ